MIIKTFCLLQMITFHSLDKHVGKCHSWKLRAKTGKTICVEQPPILSIIFDRVSVTSFSGLNNVRETLAQNKIKKIEIRKTIKLITLFIQIENRLNCKVKKISSFVSMSSTSSSNHNTLLKYWALSTLKLPVLYL